MMMISATVWPKITPGTNVPKDRFTMKDSVSSKISSLVMEILTKLLVSLELSMSETFVRAVKSSPTIIT